jgi:hypothetical protein
MRRCPYLASNRADSKCRRLIAKNIKDNSPRLDSTVSTVAMTRHRSSPSTQQLIRKALVVFRQRREEPFLAMGLTVRARASRAQKARDRPLVLGLSARPAGLAGGGSRRASGTFGSWAEKPVARSTFRRKIDVCRKWRLEGQLSIF